MSVFVAAAANRTRVRSVFPFEPICKVGLLLGLDYLIVSS